MSVKTTTELLTQIRDRFGEEITDEAITFIEDVSDTLKDLEAKANSETNWEQKYKENDETWRKKYRDRFFEGNAQPDHSYSENDDDDTYKPKTFEQLFKEE